MSTRFRIVLPSVIGVASLLLMIWDIHNERVIVSMGMAWDTGAPIWPYQTSDILLRLLDGPAYFVAVPMTNVLRLADARQYVLIFPAILIWWWLLGLRLDRGPATVNARWRWPVFSVQVVIAALLLWAGVSIAAGAFRWWFQYAEGFGRAALLMMARFLTPTAWCLAIFFLVLTAAKRVANSR